MSKAIADALWASDPEAPARDGNITDALILIGRALTRIASAIENHAGGDSPLHGSTLDAVNSGLSEVAEAIRDATSNGKSPDPTP